jgi:two-component system nitrogen regulation response regulator NtrX
MEWPGNVRELRNTVERLLILARGDTIRAADVDYLVSGEVGPARPSGELMGVETFTEFKERAEEAFIRQKLAENDWNVSETARRVEMPRSNLYKKIEKYGLERD